MAKHLSIKPVIVSTFVLILVIFGCFQNASAESLSGYTANNDPPATTSATAFSTVTSVTVTDAVSDGDPILVVVTFMTESTGVLNVQKNPQFNLTTTEGTPDNTIYRSLQGVSGGDADKGIGSIVNIYTADTSDLTPTYYFQHRSTTGGQIQTKATIVAIPLTTDASSILASAAARSSVAWTGSPLEAPYQYPAPLSPAPAALVPGTNITVDTTTPVYTHGAYYVAASVETYTKTSGGSGDIGFWQLQYSTDGSTWINLGLPVQRAIQAPNRYGIANLVGLLPDQTPATNYQFRVVHQQLGGSNTIYTNDVNIVAVFTGLSGGVFFPTYSVLSQTVTTNSTTLTEAIGYDFVPQTATTSLFMHSQYWMSSTGKDYAHYDLSVTPPPTFTAQQFDRYLPAGSSGSGTSAGLASGLLSSNTYRVSLRHSHDATGQTLRTNNPKLFMWDLNTSAPVAVLSVTKACSDLILGANDALIYEITVSNTGTEASTIVSLTDDIPSGVGGNLTDIKYVIGDTSPAFGTAWPGTNTISLGSLASGESHTVRIYADVPSIISTPITGSPVSVSSSSSTTATATCIPVVSAITVGTISGTVFDDLSGDGILDTGEPGLSGVTLELYDNLFTLLYGTYTSDINGYYEFTGRVPDDYGVREINPTYYNSTTADDVNVTLTDGGSETINFGDQLNGDADLEISKLCAPLFTDGTDQLTFLITVTNNGPDAADNVVLTDNLYALTVAGLSNLNYTEDGGALTAWPMSNTLTWASMASGTSHLIRIYANVPENFVPEENTATVISDTYDSNILNNTAFCTSGISAIGERALEFSTIANNNVTVASSASLNLSVSGTLEAWIYPTEFLADAGIMIKGTTAPSYGFGLGGGTEVAGDVFSEGTAQNIGFVLYDNLGTKHILTADAYAISLNRWHHVACTWTGAAPGNIDINIYINGILEASDTIAFANAVQTNTEDLIIGFNGLTSNNYTGVIDEVRVWNEARIQTRIQDTLCHKITSSETDYADLMASWRFDEDSGSFCNDVSAYGNIGNSNATRICSEAPVGDASAHDYDGNAAAEFEVFFPSDYGDSMTVTGDGGTWDDAPATIPPYPSCLQVYRVDHAPIDVAQPFLWKSLETAAHYWGVFKAGGTDPTYKAVYTYTGYPGINNEESLGLAYRSHNCESWKISDATLDTVSHTLTLTGLSGTEFILGQNVDPRNTIDFDFGSSQYVQVADGVAASDLDPTASGAVEAWINLSSYQSNAGIIHKGDGTTDSYSLYMGTGASSNLVYFSVDDGSAPVPINSTITLDLNTWYHIAGTWDGTNMDLYINGILEATTGTAIAAQDSAGPLYIGVRQTAGPSYFDGSIDEVRVWTVNRTQTNIRDYMCRKLAGSEFGLGGYWRFDEETTSPTTPDYDLGTANDGTMFGFGTAGNIIDARTCSAAPIGDDSAYDYTPATTSANLAHPNGDDMTAAAQFAADWGATYTGIQVYRIDEAPVYSPDIHGPLPYDPYTTPNGLTPPAGWSSIDYYRYWGVFVTDWINTPSYQIVYNYDGNPSVPSAPADEAELGLAIRDQYCDRTWADTSATLDTTANTLTHTNETVIDEYVLGGINQPLAIALASFYAEFNRENECIRLTWETATEVDTIGFQLWRSDTGEGPYTLMPGSFQSSKSVSETTGATYSYSDCDADLDTYMTFYYKLEEIDLDSTRENPFYGPIGPVTETVSASQFSRSNTPKASSGGCFIDALEW